VLSDDDPANDALSAAEPIALKRLLEFPVNSLRDVRRKAAYLLRADHAIAANLDPEHVVALLRSMR
jgi:hypothetical protein